MTLPPSLSKAANPLPFLSRLRGRVRGGARGGPPKGKAMYTLYSMQRSGNSYKVRLALAKLGIPYLA